MKYYCVKSGRTTGIFTTWAECNDQIRGYSGAMYKSFDTHLSAINYMNESGRSSMNAIYSDGGHNRQTGDEAWGSVVDGSGNDLVNLHRHIANDMHLRDVVLPVGKRTIIVSKFNDVRSQQDNGAELLSAIFALRFANMIDASVREINMDSKLITDHWSIKLGDRQRRMFDPNKIKYIDELIRLRASFEKNKGEIRRIEGRFNLADLGYHK